MKKLIALFFVLSATLVNAQTFDVPANVQLKSANDYQQYKQAVVAAAKWLEETDLDKRDCLDKGASHA